MRLIRGVLLTGSVVLTLLVGALPARADLSSGSTAASVPAAVALELLGRWNRGPVYSSAVSGDYVFFGSGGAIRVLRTKEDASISREVASIDTSGVVRDLYISGSHLYVADDSGALIIIDISDPEAAFVGIRVAMTPSGSFTRA